MATRTTFALIQQHFDSADMRYRVADEDRSIIETGFQGRHGVYKVVVHLDEAQDTLVFLAPHYLVIPEAHPNRFALLDQLMALNYKLTLGNFGFDPRDGEVNFKISLPLEDSALEFRQFERAIGTLMAEIDRRYPPLISCVWSGSGGNNSLLSQLSSGMSEDESASDENDVSDADRFRIATAPTEANGGHF